MGRAEEKAWETAPEVGGAKGEEGRGWEEGEGEGHVALRTRERERGIGFE